MKWKIIILLSTITFNLITAQVLADFSGAYALDDWYVVNDGVMGGLSQGKLNLSETGTAIFSGFVTTENNGGFSSIRSAFKPIDASPYSKVVIRLKGDKKTYQFRIKKNEYQRFSYVKNFKTNGDWQTIEILFKEFYPSFRGYRLRRENFNGVQIGEIGILIGNKVKEEFRLEIKSIKIE